MDHPSFFHSVCSTRGAGGFLPDGEPSSLSRSVGNASVLPGELGSFPNDGTPRNNKPAPSSIADIRRNSPYTSGNTPLPKTKMASNSCKPSEAMVKIINFVELPIVCGALLQSPELLLRAFPFWSVQNLNRIILKGMKRKISPSSRRKAEVGPKLEDLIGGSIFLSKGGLVQVSVKGGQLRHMLTWIH